MVADFFDSLLQEVGANLKITDLRSDSNNSCLIKFVNGVSVQLEPDPTHQFLILGSELGVVQPGRYRENILREALKANGSPPPLHGILAFNKKKQALILFSKLLILGLTGEKITQELTPFIEKASIWVRALTTGDVPTTSSMYTAGKQAAMFGLRP